MKNKYIVKSLILSIGILSCMVALPGSKKKSVQIRKKASLVAFHKKSATKNKVRTKPVMFGPTSGLRTGKKAAIKKLAIKKVTPKKTVVKKSNKVVAKKPVSKKGAASKKSTAAQTAAKKISSPTFMLSDENGNNLKIVLIKNADITQQKNVDAIVNAANPTLLGGGGIDDVIHKAAGPQLKKYCAQLNGCPTGESKISPAFNLSKNGIKHIIHTVGPRGSMADRKKLLYGAYRSIFQLAQKNKLKSVVIPTISTGIYGYPQKEATEIALEVLRWYVGNVHNKSLKEVRFIVWGDEHYNLYKKAFQVLPRIIKKIKQKTPPKPVKKVTPSNPEALGNCPICQEDLDAAPVEQRKKLSCGHLLHEECFKQCQEHGTSRCPVCRKDVITVVPAHGAAHAPAMRFTPIPWGTLQFNLSDGSVYTIYFGIDQMPYQASRLYPDGRYYPYSVNEISYAGSYVIFSDGSDLILRTRDSGAVVADFYCYATHDSIAMNL